MALEMHDDILLDTDVDGSGLPVNGYDIHYGDQADVPYAAVSSERSLTGDLQVHRTTSAGSVMTFLDRDYQVVATRAEMELLKADLGKICYFMPHYRDDADTATYRVVVLFERMTPAIPFDPMNDYWHSTVHLTDASALTVD